MILRRRAERKNRNVVNGSDAISRQSATSTELVLILDRSGSMHGLESDTIGGFNSMVDKQRESDCRSGGTTYVTTVLFDDQYELIHDHAPISQVKKLTEEDYVPRGCTALHDAMGRTISNIWTRHNKNKNKGEDEKVVFVIITDGMENASREFNASSVRKLVEKRRKADDWEFVFLGANIDVITEAGSIGICEDMAIPFAADGCGVKKNFDTAIRAVEAMAAPAPMRSKVIRGE